MNQIKMIKIANLANDLNKGDIWSLIYNCFKFV